MAAKRMNSSGRNTAGIASATAPFEHQVRVRIETLSYLPTTVAVAMKFIELGKDLETEPSEYAKVISSDSSLSSKLLSLVNSSWFGVRNKVTKVNVAVNLLGLSTVRTLAISYCATGLHNELRLSPSESKMFWSACLCKAVVAKQYANLHDDKIADEAFAGAMFQDFAIPVMYVTAREQVQAILQDTAIDVSKQLEQERALFRLDHAQLGRTVAQKLELPDLYVDAVAFHHDHNSLREFIDREVLADAMYVASLFPHVLDSWNRQDAETLGRFLEAHGGITTEEFLASAQQEFDALYGYFEPDSESELKLTDLLVKATREISDNTTRLVSNVHELMQQAASAGKEVFRLLKRKDQAEEAATHDPLTGALNREGFAVHAQEGLAQAHRYGISYAVAYLDVDHFKNHNDVSGHGHGDAVLQMIVSIAKKHLRQRDVIGRLGGDEFVLLLNDLTCEGAVAAVKRIAKAIASTPVGKTDSATAKVSVSVGLVSVPPRADIQSMAKLIEAADTLMYQAKRAGGNRLYWQAIPDEHKRSA